MSELALEIIRKNIEKHRNGEDARTLDLGNCGMTEIPELIKKCVWVEELILSSSWEEFYSKGLIWELCGSINNDAPNQLTNLPDFIPNLSQLRKLIFADNPIKNLAPLVELKKLQWLDCASTQVTDLTPLINLKQLQVIDCSNTPVKDLAPLANIKNLQSIYCFSNEINNLNPLTNLKQLQSLGIYSEYVTDFSPLAQMQQLQSLFCNRITLLNDLTPLISLQQLQLLDCSATQVVDLAPLANLQQLRSLTCSLTSVNDLTPLANLKQLQRLDCSNTLISDLTPLTNLKQLKILDCSYTQVDDLEPLNNLENLGILSCSFTQVSDLRPVLSLIQKGIRVWHDYPRSYLNHIYVKNCPLTNPPVEVVELGNAAILRWFERIDHGAKPMYLREARVVLVGEGESGKTTLRKKLLNHAAKMPGRNSRTRGIDVEPYQFKYHNEDYTAYLWDFGGQDIYYAVHRFFMSESAVYVLMSQSRADKHNFEYWLPNIQLFAGDKCPVLVFKNLHKGFKGENMSLAHYKGHFNIPEDIFEVDLSRKDKPDLLDEFKKKLHNHITALPHLQKTIFEHELDVRDHLRSIQEPYISFDTFRNICLKFGVGLDNSADIDILAQYLHNLGIVLWYNGRPFLEDIIILQPIWATGAVYKIIDDQRIAACNGHFDEKDLKRIWNTKTYADKHRELIELMKAFKLCYERKDKQGYIIPARLSAELPNIAAQWISENKDVWTRWQSGGQIGLVYHYHFMPRGLVNQLTAELHQYIQEDAHAWNRGVVLHYDERDARAFIEEDQFSQKITIQVRGQAAREFLVLIKKEMEILHRDFPGVAPVVKIPCICDKCRNAEQPEVYEYEKVLRWVKEDRGRKIRCHESGEEFLAIQLLENIGELLVRVFRHDKNMLEDIDFDVIPVSDSPIRVPPPAPKPFKGTLRIFLASSDELREDRVKFRNFISEKNDQLQDSGKGVYLRLENWEAMSETMGDRKQDDYNERVRNCDLFICLAHTKVGKYTEEEFDVAWATRNASKSSSNPKGKPLMLVYFKNEAVSPDKIQPTLGQFRQKISDLGHFPGKYNDYADLERQFMKELAAIIGH